MNDGHGLSEDDDNTFIAHLLDKVNLKANKKTVKWWVRNPLYVILAIWTWVWQVYLGYEVTWF